MLGILSGPSGCCSLGVGHHSTSLSVKGHVSARKQLFNSCVCKQEDDPDSSAVHAMFDRLVEELAAASEDYQREAIAFLRGLLEPDPKKRMTAQDALGHPFLTGSFPELAPDLVPVVEDPYLIDSGSC
jgi:hypothetical protein